MSAFTETDRKFIRKIASQVGELDKRVKKLEMRKAVESITKDAMSESKRQVSAKQKYHGNSSIEVTFTEPDDNIASQRVLIESIYQTLQDVCKKNNISSMEIFIDATN